MPSRMLQPFGDWNYGGENPRYGRKEAGAVVIVIFRGTILISSFRC